MRIRRRERDLPDTSESSEPADLPYDQEGVRSPDPVSSLITEKVPAEPDAADTAPTPPPAENAPPPPAPEAVQTAPEGPTTPSESSPASAAGADNGAPASGSEPAEEVPVAAAAPSPPVVTEPETAAAPASAPPAVAPPAPATMRPPSIGDEATELLNGSKPVPRELPRVMAVANQKGGVGKTTTTVNLGAALAEMDYRVLVIDLDPQGNATTGLGVEARNFELSMYDVIMRDQPLEDCIEPTSVKNLFVAPATIDLAGVEIELVPAFSRELKLKRAIATVVDDFDFILIDCPPSLGLITVNGLAAADEVLVPIQCEYYALEGLSQLLRNVNLVSTNLNQTLEVTTIVLTMYDARTRLSVDVANEVREHFSERVCRSVIPRTVRLSEAPSFGQPITVFDPASRGAVAYRELAKEVSNGAPQRTR